MQQLHDYVVSLIRTAVPAGVGAALAWLAVRGLDLAPEVRVQVISAITALAAATFTAAYYAVVRALETRWPAFGRLLGKKAAPTYTVQR